MKNYISTIKLLQFYVLFCMLPLISCSSDDSSGATSSDPEIEKVILTSPERLSGQATDIFVHQNDVYISGYESTGNKFIATYWKNGVITDLTDGSNNAHAYSIFVENQDVYASGRESTGDTYVAKYWKNGMPVALTDGTQQAEGLSIFVSNGDIYVAGYEREDGYGFAKYWKNGTAHSLSNVNSEANSIVVVNGDVYVAGWERTENGRIAKYWKNGVGVNLTSGNTFADALDIFVDGSDVYVIGYEGLDVKYWKNGEAVELPGKPDSGTKTGNAIYIEGSDIYVAGAGSTTTADYWKNGNREELASGISTKAMGIMSNNGIIHIAGYERINAFDQVVYWKVNY